MKQPEALRLAKEFRQTMPRDVMQEWGGDAQKELRRLHEANQVMLEALEGTYALAIGHAATYQFQHELPELHPTHHEILQKARAAIAKGEAK